MTIKKKNPYSTAGRAFAFGAAVAALSLGIVTDPANANGTTASQTVEIRADIPTMCQYEGSFDSSLNLPLHNGRPAGELSQAETTNNITCNTAADVELVSRYGGAVHREIHIRNNESPLGGDQMTSFDYIATLEDSSGVLATLNTADTGGINSEETSGLASAFDSSSIPSNTQVTLEIEPEEFMGVLQSGTYIDEITVKVIPN